MEKSGKDVGWHTRALPKDDSESYGNTWVSDWLAVPPAQVDRLLAVLGRDRMYKSEVSLKKGCEITLWSKSGVVRVKQQKLLQKNAPNPIRLFVYRAPSLYDTSESPQTGADMVKTRCEVYPRRDTSAWWQPKKGNHHQGYLHAQNVGFVANNNPVAMGYKVGTAPVIPVQSVPETYRYKTDVNNAPKIPKVKKAPTLKALLKRDQKLVAKLMKDKA